MAKITIFLVATLSVSLWGQHTTTDAHTATVTHHAELYSDPTEGRKIVGFVNEGQSVTVRDYTAGYAFVETNGFYSGLFRGWIKTRFLKESGCYQKADQDLTGPRAVLKYRTRADSVDYSSINGEQPITVGEWLHIRGQLASLIPYVMPRKTPIPGVETNIIKLQGFLTGASESDNGELKLILRNTLSASSPKDFVIIPAGSEYCELHHEMVKLLEDNGKEAKSKNEDQLLTYTVTKPVFIEIRGFIFVDLRAAGLSFPDYDNAPQDIRIPTVAIPPTALTICPVVAFVEGDPKEGISATNSEPRSEDSSAKKIALNPQRNDAEEIVESSLAEVESSFRILASNGVDVAPETLEAVAFMKANFIKPGYIPDRYISVLRISGKLLFSIASKTPEFKPVNWSQKSIKPTDLQKDIEDNLQFMARSSKESPGGIVKPIPLSVTTMAAHQGASPTEVSGWEIFYMEYFLRHLQKEVGPSSFKNPSSPSHDDLPPGRYLFQAVDPITKQKGEIKVFTVTKTDNLSLFVP